MLLIGPGTVITFGPESSVLADAGVVVDQGVVSAVGNFKELCEKHGEAERLDAGGGVILPGLIDAATDLTASLFCGISNGGGAEAEVRSSALEREDLYPAAVSSLLAGLRCGVTTVFDHLRSPSVLPGGLDEIARAVGDCGLRAVLTYDIDEKDGEITLLSALAENERFIESHQEDPLLRGMMGLALNAETTPETIDSTREVFQYLHSGLAVDLIGRGEASPVALLEKAELLGEKTVLSRFVHLCEEDREILASTETGIVHTPRADLLRRDGLTPVAELLEHGIYVGLGSAGLSSNMLEELRLTALLQGAASGEKSDSRDAVELVMEGNPFIASRIFARLIGVLREGAEADVVVFDYHPATPLDETTVRDHLFGALGSRPARHVLCGGRVLVKDGELQIDVDEKDTARICRERAVRLWSKIMNEKNVEETIQ